MLSYMGFSCGFLPFLFEILEGFLVVRLFFPGGLGDAVLLRPDCAVKLC